MATRIADVWLNQDGQLHAMPEFEYSDIRFEKNFVIFFVAGENPHNLYLPNRVIQSIVTKNKD